jgi:hypothetical protein
MAVTNIREIFGRTYDDDPQNAHAVRVFRVTCDTPTYFLAEIADDPVMAQLGELYSLSRPDLRCVGREISEVSRSLTEFNLTMTYNRFPYGSWDVKTSTQQVERVLDETAEATVGVGLPQRFVISPAKYLTTKPLGSKGEQVLNRAKDAFDPPVMGQRTQLVINAEIMVDAIYDLGSPAFASVSDLTSLAGKVNSERIQVFSCPDETGIGADYWTLLLDEVTVTKIKTPTGCAYLVALRIVYDPLAHCPVVLNAGYNELVEPGTANEKRRKCRGEDQAEVSSPVPLDANGQRVTAANLPAGATYIVFPSRETFAWSKLGLPTTFCGTSITPSP